MVAACHIIKLGNRWRRHQAHSDYDLKLDSDKQPKTAETVEDCRRLQTVDCRLQSAETEKEQAATTSSNRKTAQQLQLQLRPPTTCKCLRVCV